MNSPKFSIVLPIYNVEKYLDKSIKSVLNQTEHDYEIILVDDESPDNCPAICDAYAEKYDFIRVVHQRNADLAGARNAGLAVASGKYIFFLDSDDTIQPDTFAYFNKIINEIGEDVEIIASEFQNVKLGEEFKEAASDRGYEIMNREQIQNAFLLRTRVILAPGTLYNISWLKKNGLRFEPNPYSEDQLFIWRSLMVVNEVVYIHKALYNYLSHPGSIMSGSKLNNIKRAYPFFVQLDVDMKNSDKVTPLVSHYMLSRWVMGILHSSSKLCLYSEYKELMEVFEAKRHCRNIISFPSFTMKLFGLSYYLGPWIFYRINKMI